MKTNLKIISAFLLLLFIGCVKEDQFTPDDKDQAELALTVEVKELSAKQLEVQSYVKERPIIAHRGTIDYAPENTEPAYRFAKTIGADYILIDLQMTSDGHLVCFRNDLNNHSDIAKKFPGFENAPVNHFTLEEIKSLDVGSWFTSDKYERESFKGLKILTLEEVINICEGKLIDGTPDPDDVKNRPGIYIRLYEPWLNSGIEEKLKEELTRLAWLGSLKNIDTYPYKVDVANTKARVFLATMEKMSLTKIEEVFQGELPVAFWLWNSSNYMKETDAKSYADYISFGIEHGAQFIAPNTSTHNILNVWQSNLIRRTKAKIQGFNIDKKADMAKYTYNNLDKSAGNVYQLEYDLTDGFITNRPQYALFFYGRYYLGEKRFPEPPFYSTADIKSVFTILGY